MGLDKNGPQGSGVNEDVSFTLNATDHHAVAYPTYCTSKNSYFMRAEKELANTLVATDYKYLGAKMGAKGMLSEQPRLYPLFQKLIDTMKYKPETPEQAAKRTETQNSRTKKNAESWLDSAVLGSLKRYGDESTLEQYAALKDAFLSGEVA